MKSTPKISLISLNYLQTYLNSLFLTIFKRISKDLSHVMSEFLSYVLGELRKGVVTQIIFCIVWFSGTPKSGFPRLQVASSLTLSVSLSLSLSLLSNSGCLPERQGTHPELSNRSLLFFSSHSLLFYYREHRLVLLEFGL